MGVVFFENNNRIGSTALHKTKMDKIKQQLKEATSILDGPANEITFFKVKAEEIGINSGLFLAAFMLIGAVIISFFYGWQLVVTLVTVIYPALNSIRAIEKNDKEGEKVWLTYWMVYGGMTFLDTFAGFILRLIPHWDIFNLVFFVWLMLPQFQGARWLYETFLGDMLRKHKGGLDNLLKKFKLMTNDAAG